jgi:hypothetical protein
MTRSRITAYLVKHWRGDLGLGRSYWVNLVLLAGTAFIIAVGTVSAAGLLDTAPPVSAGNRSAQIGASLGLHIGAIAYTVLILWQVTGVWRAAERQIAIAGEKLWARVAQGSLLAFLGCIGIYLA